MTHYEIFLTTIIWIIVGIWIAYKRDWYNMNCGDAYEINVTLSIIFAPINLIITIYKI